MTSGVLFIENYIAGGSDQVARILMQELPFSKLILMVNRRNDTRILLASVLPPNVEVVQYGLLTIPELFDFARLRRHALSRTLLRYLVHILRYPLIGISVFYFMLKIARTGTDVFVANNGGYPAGDYCRSATIAASCLPGLKVFHIVHSMAKPAPRLLFAFEWLLDRLIDRGSRLITESEAAAQQLKAVRAIHQHAEVIANGLPDIPKTTQKRNPGLLHILCIGYFDRNKNQMILIRAVAELAKLGYSGWELTFIGTETSDGLQAECQRQAVNLGISDRVFFEGFVRETEPWMQRASLFVLCSDREGFPITILEAMRAGKPVIATNVGGIPEQVKNDENGYIIEPGDHLALASRIETLLCNPEKLVSFGIASRRLFEEKFSLGIMIARYLKVFEIDALPRGSVEQA